MPITDENIFIAAACGQKGITFLKGEAKLGIRKVAPKKEGSSAGAYTVSVGGEKLEVELYGGKEIVNGTSYDIDIKEGIDASAKSENKAAASSGASVEIKAPLPGAVMRFSAQEGTAVKKGQTILVMEAMKMETEIKAPADGKISYKVKTGDQVQTGTLLAVLG